MLVSIEKLVGTCWLPLSCFNDSIDRKFGAMRMSRVTTIWSARASEKRGNRLDARAASCLDERLNLPLLRLATSLPLWRHSPRHLPQTFSCFARTGRTTSHLQARRWIALRTHACLLNAECPFRCGIQSSIQIRANPQHETSKRDWVQRLRFYGGAGLAFATAARLPPSDAVHSSFPILL